MHFSFCIAFGYICIAKCDAIPPNRNTDTHIWWRHLAICNALHFTPKKNKASPFEQGALTAEHRLQFVPRQNRSGVNSLTHWFADGSSPRTAARGWACRSPGPCADRWSSDDRPSVTGRTQRRLGQSRADGGSSWRHGSGPSPRPWCTASGRGRSLTAARWERKAYW